MVALFFMHYDFGRVHQALRVTPAMELASQITYGGIVEIVGLLDGGQS